MILNLEKIITNLEENRFPAKFDEVWNYGSFLRDKKNPKDLDLILKYTEINDDYYTFLDIIPLLLENKPKSFTPLDALKKIENFKFYDKWKNFPFWLSNMDWNTLKQKESILNMTLWMTISRQILQNEFPQIQIGEIIPVNRSPTGSRKSFELLWSRNNSPLQKNLKRIFSERSLRFNLINEIYAFEEDISNLDYEIKISNWLLNELICYEYQFEDETKLKKWFKTKIEKKFPNIHQNTIITLVDNIFHDNHKNNNVNPKMNYYILTMLPITKLKSQAEKNRFIVKERKKTLIIYKYFLQQFSKFKIYSDLHISNKQFDDVIISLNAMFTNKKDQILLKKILDKIFLKISTL